MEFIFKKTNELLAKEKGQICALFNEVFSKEKSLAGFDRQFTKTTLGYSYHGLMVDNDKIVGAYTAIPFRYHYFGKETLFALAVDTMIAEKQRGNPFNLKKMANQVYAAIAKDGIPFVFGFPNDNVYLIRKKVLGWLDIGKLDFYLLPIRIGAVAKKLAFLNILSGTYSYLVNKLPKRLDACHPGGGKAFNIDKVNDNAFINYRYDDEYHLIKGEAGAYFVYKYDIEDGVRVAFLIDVFPIDKGWLEAAVKHVYDNSHLKADLIMYVGRLNFLPINMIKVPKRFAPRQIHMSGKILDPAFIDDRVFDIKNWNVNLSNYDVR